MSGLRLVLVGVVTAIGIFYVDRNCRPSTRTDLPQEPTADSPQELTVPALDEVRKVERSRRAVRPAGDPERKHGLIVLFNYEQVLKGGKGADRRPHPRPVEPLPPTYCRSVEPVPEDADPFSGLHKVHDRTIMLFESESGFGFWRMGAFKNDRGVYVASLAIDRVELVSLLTDYQPSVYVLDEMATPALARQAKRRQLDEFERLSLDAVRRGEEVMWTREAPMRMFGAIRAKAECLDCHSNAKEGDLLGAFTYYLNTPVDKLKDRE